MLDKNYILGLVDGEGSFNVQLNKPKNRRTRVYVRFSLKLRHQDKEILHKLQSFFGCGKVYVQKDKRKNHSLCYRYEVCSKKELMKNIIPFFEQNPPKIPSRKRDFELFRRILELLNEDKNSLEEIRNLKIQMHWGLAVYGKTVRTVGTQSSF